MATPRFWLAATVELARRPDLWMSAVAQGRRVARRSWWRRPPYLPVPDLAYVRYRRETQYGPHGVPEPADVVTYLEWCKHERARRTAVRSGPEPPGAAGGRGGSGRLPATRET